MIDFHVHLGRLFREHYPARPPAGVHQLIDRMNREGIDKAVLLPLESPEGGWGYWLTEDAVAARDEYPGRLIAFVCVDPRYPNSATLIEHAVTRLGCKGFGEHVCGLALDDPLNLEVYGKCDELGLPLVVELNHDLNWDEPGLPRLERCLREFPNVRWCGHGPAFWSAISADDPRQGYPSGPVREGGALDRLLAEHDNLYADLSAYSGYNAMTRDPGFAAGFVDRHWPRLLFGTDYMWHAHELPIVGWLKELDVPEAVRHAIAAGNAEEVLS